MAADGVFTLGLAMKEGRREKYFSPLVDKARERGVKLVEIDTTLSLAQQGPFDAIVHKVPGEEWIRELEAFHNEYPEVKIADPPAVIARVFERQSMLDTITQLKLSTAEGSVDTPKQIVATSDSTSIQAAMEVGGLKFPLVVKPLYSDSSISSHKLAMAYDESGFSKLRTPILLQEFLNHGGVMFKVYAAGAQVMVVQRPSLPDVAAGLTGLASFPRISAADEAIGVIPTTHVPVPPQALEPPPFGLMKLLVEKIQATLGLTLFNLDIIRKGGRGNHYFAIDINYFPGYYKLTDYETFLVNYFTELANAHQQKIGTPPLKV